MARGDHLLQAVSSSTCLPLSMNTDVYIYIYINESERQIDAK